ncbi:MAG: oligosaccharide flippase family protein [Bacteroidales bacterium]|nr:oligosaccharide flippase family protein [Bacteroidales bacterium]
MNIKSNIIDLRKKLNKSSFFKDSFWAVCGNGIGYALLLVSGIIIAHLLGKSEYGEYGLVKTTMFFIASFASFGLNYTSTKFIASSLKTRPEHVNNYIKTAISITIISSIILSLILEIFAPYIAKFLDEPSLTLPLRLLGVLIIVRSLTYTLIAILAGFGDFKKIAISNVTSGVTMLILSIPFTYYCGLAGALGCLIISQLVLLLINGFFVERHQKKLINQIRIPVLKEIISVSYPVALHEAAYSIFHWLGVMLITKMATLGQLGIYSAASQWNAIILFIPNILVNVIVSNLSKHIDNTTAHHKIIKLSLLSNLGCTVIPFIIILFINKFIASLYGPTFVGLAPVINVMIFATIFICCSNVFYSEFIANGKTMIVFIARVLRDSLLLLLAYILIKNHSIDSAALQYAIATVIASAIHFLFLGICYLKYQKQHA